MEINTNKENNISESELKLKIKLNLFGIMIATLGTLCFPQMLNLKKNGLVFTNSIFSVLVWLLCMYAVNLSLNTIDLHDKRGWVIAGALSFLFTTAMLFGVRLEAEGNVDFKDWRFWVSLPALTCLFTILVRKFWNFLSRMELRKRMFEQNIKMPKLSSKLAGKENIAVFIIFILCWLPVLLAVYPGFFVYDAQDEYVQVASRNFNTHHPLAHVLMLGGIICAVHKITDSYNMGIAAYILAQMCLVSGTFTYLIYYLRKKRVSKFVRIAAVLYFAFFPVIVMFTLCSAKDAIFTSAFLLLLINLLEMGMEQDEFFASKRSIAFFILSAVTMLLFRKNGIYAFIVIVPVLILYHRKYRKKICVILITILASYFLITASLTLIFHAQTKENQEMLTVPIQQLARTYKFNREAFDDEDIETLHEVLPEEALALYNPKLADPVKHQFNNAAYMADKSRYVRLWFKILKRKPLSYFNAWLMTSYGFWYPDTVIDVYSGNTVFTFTYKDSSYFGYEVELPGVRDSKIPWLDEAYRRLSLELEQEKIPILSMLYSPGGLFWAFAFIAGYAFYRRKYYVLIPYLLVLALWLTVILGPTYLPRYVLILWFGLPLFAAQALEEEKL